MKPRTFAFERTYLWFGCLFAGSSLASVLFLIWNGAEALWVILSYIAAITLLVTGFVWATGRKVRRVIQRMDDMVEQAIAHQDLDDVYEETSLAALESKLKRFLTMSNTVAAKREQEKNLIQSLISDISHQTKTPIANIVLYAQLLQEQPLPPEAGQLLREVGGQSEKLSFLIQALIKMSRMESGLIHVNRQPSSVNKLLDTCLLSLEPKASAKDIQLDYTGEDSSEAIFDPKWMAEAVDNLLDNAIKYTPPGGRIVITVKPYEMFTRVEITDTGIGMEEGEINEIFKRFYRSQQVKHQEGVGIGLYLAREIISMQGGFIKVQSTPGEGSTFSVFLPNRP